MDTVNREMRKALLSRARYDWDTHEATRQRNAEQIRSIPAPQYPATGTARISALLAVARRRRDEAYVVACTEAGSGMRTGTPLDSRLPSTAPTPTTPAQPRGVASAR